MPYRIPVLILTLTAMLIFAACGGGSDQDVMELIGTEWKLSELHGAAPPAEVEITLAFQDALITGRSACNSYFAEYIQDGFSLRIGEIGTTNMYCDGLMDLEADYFRALGSIAGFNLSNQHLVMLDQAGATLLRFTK